MKSSAIAEEIIDVIGLDAAKKLLNAYGGKVVKIPVGVRCEGSFIDRLIDLLGLEAYQKLIARFGGERISIPIRAFKPAALKARNREIVADYTAGKSISELVNRYDLGERQLRNILKLPSE